MKYLLTLVLGLVICITNIANAQESKKLPPFQAVKSTWADSVFAKLTLEERIGQLFMVAAYSNKDAAHEKELAKLVKDYHLGGLIFFQGGPVRQAGMYNRLQDKAKVPLWVGMDAEWGLSMRLDSTIKFPRQMTLGAIENDSLIYAMGAEIARQSKRLGVHVNFAPVVDVNNNAANPVINSRSFGENKQWVSRKSIAYMKGMQDNGVLANAKHFPGHGDTGTDSHHALPVIKHDRKRLDDIELYPFRKLINEGLGSIMVAHLSIPALDSTPNRASTLSPAIVTDLLKKELDFKGLIFTDALNMKGVAGYYPPGVVDLMAAQAGNDVLLFAEDVPKAMAAIKDAINSGTYTEADLNRSVMKILKAKEWAGLNKYRPIALANLDADLNTPAGLHLKKKLSEAAITLVKNDKNMVPLKNLDTRKISVITIGGNGTVFKNRLAKYCDFSSFETSSEPTLAEGKAILESLADRNTVIINVEGTNNTPSKNFGLSKAAISLIESVAAQKDVILVHMGSPYALAGLKSPQNIEAILVGYQDDTYLSRAAAEALMGAIPIKGKLPVSVGSYFPAQTGIVIAGTTRLHYTSPMEIGLSPDAFARIDTMVEEGIRKRAYPGAQVLVAKGGKVIYNKNFGFHTYDEQQPVRSTDIYDLASITKVVASTLSLMKLDEAGKFDLDSQLHTYFPEIEAGSPYYDMIPRRMLAHVAGLPAWIPFYQSTLAKGEPRWDIYSQAPSDIYTRRVAYKMYINQKVSDSLLTKILLTPLRPTFDYKYSDLGYYFMQEIVERQSGKSLDRYAADNFYHPLGLSTMGYKPLDRFPKDRIIPTEYDTYFRKQLVHGDVHDPGAAMRGGVGGHAGIFSNAEDLAALMQMLINGGTYGGSRYLKEETIEEYTRCQFCKDERDENRRGAGFDKPVMTDGPGPTCKCISFDSFGHTGFTGTIVWADPVEDIIYVFLSNRVYPSAENNKLAKLNIRTNVQAEIYRVLDATHRLDTASTTTP